MARVTDEQLACVLRESVNWIRDPDSPKKRGRWSVDANNNSCDPLDEYAERWCVLGHVSVVTRLNREQILDRIGDKAGTHAGLIINAFDAGEDDACIMYLEQAAVALECN